MIVEILGIYLVIYLLTYSAVTRWLFLEWQKGMKAGMTPNEVGLSLHETYYLPRGVLWKLGHFLFFPLIFLDLLIREILC